MNFYYHPDPKDEDILSNEESAHAIKVLRMKVGDIIHLMDGEGGQYEASITEANHRKCGFKLIKKQIIQAKPFRTHIAIAPTKSVDRLEWFVEKACELGVDEISFLNTKRTERTKVNLERIEKKVIGAMKQSKSFWKCKINPLLSIKEFLKNNPQEANAFIAFVETGKEDSLQKQINTNVTTAILIGPEGDFTQEEVNSAKDSGYIPVNLGQTILRTETAGVIAAHTVNLLNHY